MSNFKIQKAKFLNYHMCPLEYLGRAEESIIFQNDEAFSKVWVNFRAFHIDSEWMIILRLDA